MMWMCLLLASQMEGVTLAPHPADAVPVVAADVQAMGERAVFMRYIWVPTEPEKAKQQLAAMQLAINAALNHSDTIQTCHILEHGVIRVDLDVMAGSRAKVFEDLRKTWDRFGGTEIGNDDHDPYFLTNFQQVTETVQAVRVKTDTSATFFPADIDPLNVPSGVVGKRFVLKAGRPYQLGKPWSHLEDRCIVRASSIGGAELLLAVVPKEVIVLVDAIQETRQPAPYLPEQIQSVIQATGSRAPIVHADEFLRRAITQLDGFGMYYDFRRIRKSNKPGVTDFDFIIAGLTGLTLDEATALRGRQTAIIQVSKVTGRQRMIWGVQAAQSKLGTNQGMVVVTADFAKNTPDHLKPWASLDKAQPVAMEVFVELPNGQILTLLFQGYEDGKFIGSLQDEAPASVATDHAAPGAEDRRINGWLSCMRCHVIHNQQQGPWIEFTSDMGKLLRDGRTNFTTRDGLKDPESLSNLVGELVARWQKPLRRGNEDYNEMLEYLTGDVQLGAEDTPAIRITGTLSTMYASAVHDRVDAARALRYAGLIVDPEAAPGIVREMLPPVPGQVRYADVLGAGLSITTESWRGIAVDFISQATPAREALRETSQ